MRAFIIPDQTSLSLEVAGIRLNFHLVGKNKDFILKALERYGGFQLGKTAKADFSFRVQFKKLKLEPFRPSITTNGRMLIMCRGDFSCEVDLDKKSGRLLTNPSIYTFDSFLRIFLSFILLRGDGLLVHGAALCYENRAFLLAGKSGSGKSTVSRLADGRAFVLSDELVPLRLGKNSVTIFSSPFWGEMQGRGRSFKKKLSGLFLLKKSRRNLAAKASTNEFLPSFLRCVMNFSRDPSLSAKAIKKAEALRKMLNPGKLYFSNEGQEFLKLL